MHAYIPGKMGDIPGLYLPSMKIVVVYWYTYRTILRNSTVNNLWLLYYGNANEQSRVPQWASFS